MISLAVPEWAVPGRLQEQPREVPGGPWGVPRSPDALFAEFQGGPWGSLIQTLFSSVVQNTTGAEYQQRWFQKSASRSIPVTETTTEGPPEAPAGIQVGSSGGTILALLEPFRGNLC